MIKDKYFEIALNTSTSKILNELKNIKESSEEKKNEIRRRWIWELIQNASDCTPRDSSINISLEITDDIISFSHDGTPFSYDNLFSLITQCSEKQLSEENLTGKFGTGFMSTFLLSEIVEIEGTFICENGIWTDMNFTIDRTNGDYLDIRRKTEEMLSKLEILNNSTNEAVEKINKTKFIYNINGTPESVAAVKQGGEDLIATLPYLLAFNQNINSINYNGEIYERETTNSIPSPLDKNIFSIKTSNVDNNTPKYILCLKRNNVTIACPVTYDFGNKLLSFLTISENMQKLFCNFPLIGSEEYSFPIIVNSDRFDVEIDRNAIRDGNEENKKIIEEAVSLYKILIDYCTDNVNTRNEFNICLLKNRQYSGLQKYCYDEIKGYIEKKPLIPINTTSYDYERMSYLDESGRIQIHLPKAKKEYNDLLFWDLFTDGGYVNIPTRETFLGWRKVFGGNFYLKHFNSMFKEMNITDFNGHFKNELKTCEWLNRFYLLWVDDEGMEEVIISVFVPTQDKNFHLINNVFSDSNINGELKEILFALDSSYKKKLLDCNISAFGSYYQNNPLKLQDTKSCAELIELRVTAILSEETVNQAERKNEVQVTFNKLTDFFLQEPKLSEQFLPKSLSKRMLLSTPEETLRRMRIAEKVERNGIDMEGLDELLNNQQQIRNILANPRLNLEQIRALLKHVVTSTPEMRKYFEALLERSVSNVYSYLKKSQQYSLPTTLEEWKANQYTETIFPIIKDGKELTVVIRPTDGDQIIFYSEGELEVLDSTVYELWTDNGTEQKIITLGDLLKTTGITKIPLRKL
ncbi:sacsin N-terminal ATP-binding-like domain-containing protein [Sutcliffiella cohnii]|uniref:sacsin N-terminal ATP-binding-like domain-containing protein n=1 Tax=Sutcliffiella cohnii TaxID=33932 RepID=UPI000829F981|nr:ATP-binding protein [Sutcliffiella cohnii]